MPQPYNYMLGGQQPADAFMGGLKQGAALQQFQMQREEQARQQQLAQQQAQQAQMMQEALNNLAANPNPSVQDIMRVSTLLPKEQADSLRAGFTQLQDVQQANTLRFGGQVLAALTTDNTDIAADMLTKRIAAETDAGNQQDAQFYQGMLQLLETDPKTARDSIGIMLGALPGGDKFVESAIKLGEEGRTRALHPIEIKKAQSDLDLTDQQVINARKDLEIKNAAVEKAALELEAIKSGKLDPEKRFDKERTLNQEYYKRTEGLREATRTMETLKASASAKDGAGDVALITAFMKMLDPGSVVRETEFATGQKTAGLYQELQNALSRAEQGTLLSDNQRQMYINLAQKYLDAAQKEGVAAKRSIDSLVKNYNLNPDNVYGAPETPAAPKPGQTIPGPAQAAGGSFTGNLVEQLATQQPREMTNREKADAILRGDM